MEGVLRALHAQQRSVAEADHAHGAEAVRAEEAAVREVLGAALATERAEIDAWETEERRVLAEAIASLAASEDSARVVVVDEEAAARAADLEEAEPPARAAAAAAAAAREAQEVAAQRAVQEEEVVARAAACDTEEDARRTAAEGHAAGRDEATLLELTRSVAETEGAVRAAAEVEEDSERGGLLKAEFAERSALQDMLIRRSHTNSLAASAAAGGGGGGGGGGGDGEGAGEEEEAAAEVVQMRVVADAAQVRASCAMNSKRVALVHHGEVYHVVERRGNRVRLHEHGGGWLSVQGQTGNVILQLVERDADAPPIVLPERPEPEAAPQSADNSPRASTGATSSVAQDLLPQVADIGSSMQKGFSAFGGFLGSVRLPTPGAKPT